VHIVAEFHAHKIRPSRIAYRVGIDIAFIEELIAGEVEAEHFPRLVAHELQQKIEREFKHEVDL